MDAEQLVAKLDRVFANGTTAIRCRTRLLPAGGEDDKIFPPTYENGAYALETRLSAGKAVTTVLLDSVQSQANRIEKTLLTAHDAGDLGLPLVAVQIEGYGRITTLEAPHRIYDAIFRDSLLDEVPFRRSPLGQRLVRANARNATALYEYCPTVLILGGWDSHAGEGSLGARLQRALSSEIVGLNAVVGKRTSSRIDPLGITLDAGIVYKSADKSTFWILDASQAAKDSKGQPQTYRTGRLTEIGHSHIPPTIADGGVTISEARHTAVLSLPQLRRLYFPEPTTGKFFPERDLACRVVLAVLAMCGLALQAEQGYDLRSRCLLVPDTAPRYEFVGRSADAVEYFDLDAAVAQQALQLALDRAQRRGAGWQAGTVWLQAQPKLQALVARSNSLATVTEP